MEESNIRPLTREEQLIWLVGFLKEQIAAYEAQLAEAEAELKSLTEGPEKVYKR